MSDTILIAKGNELNRLPEAAWRRELAQAPASMATRLAFMTPEHHLVRDTAVREMPRHRGPLTPARLSELTGLAPERLAPILDELEARLFFLVRDAEGNLEWAFPVTTARTGHHLSYRSGEEGFAA